MTSVKISGEVTYPDPDSRWMDKRDRGRTLHVEDIVVGDRLGREIRGTVSTGGEPRNYATDIRTFDAVWEPLKVPVAKS